MKNNKLKIGVAGLVLVCLFSFMAVPQTSSAALTEEGKFKLKKDILAAFYDLTVIYYEKIEEAIDTSTWLTDSESADLLAVTGPGLVTFRDHRDKISSATTEDELTTYVDQARAKWGEVQTELRRVEGDILYYRINKVVAKATIVSGEGSAVSITLQTLGVDTASLDKLIADFDQKVKEGEAAAKAGVDIFKTIIRLGDLIKVDDALEQFSNAWQALGEAKELADKIIAEMERLVASTQ